MDYKSIEFKGEAFHKFIEKGTAIVDIGGGSIQLSLFEHDMLMVTQNLRLGVLRIREILHHVDAGRSRYEKLIEEMAEEQLSVFRTLYLKDRKIHNIIMMELANGIQATYMHCMYTPDSERNYTFIGTRGRIENIGDMDYENGVELHVWTQRGSRKKPDIVYHLHPMAGGHGGADVGIVPAFVDFVLYGKKPDVSPVDARNAVAAGYLGHQSMRNGNIPFDVPGIPAEWQEYFDNGQQ